jgi:hypothetical protein
MLHSYSCSKASGWKWKQPYFYIGHLMTSTAIIITDIARITMMAQHRTVLTPSPRSVYVFMAKPAMSVLSHLGTFAGKRCCAAQNHDIQEQLV